MIKWKHYDIYGEGRQYTPSLMYERTALLMWESNQINNERLKEILASYGSYIVLSDRELEEYLASLGYIRSK